MATKKTGGRGPSGPSAEELKAARRAGMKASKPKKPKAKTITALENYIERYGEWTKRVKAAAAQDRKNREGEVRRKKLIAVVSGL